MSKIVTASKLRVRSEPLGRIVNYIFRGAEVDVMSSSGSWSQVQTLNSFESPIRGWVANQYLQDNPYEEPEEGRIIKRIVIHCSATKSNHNATADDIRRWHTDPVLKGGRGWSRAGYHWVIERTPCSVQPLVPLNDSEILSREEISNGSFGYNKTSIHVCYVGGLNDKGRPDDNMTEEQKAEMVALLQVLVKDRPKLENIVGHNDLNPMKACPSFDVVKFIRQNFSAKFSDRYTAKR